MPLTKLQEIIIDCCQNFYKECLFQAINSNVEYPYDGPAFAFSRNGDHLDFKDNTQKLLTLPGGEQITKPVAHHGFKKPKSNQVKTAFFKFQRGQKKIRKIRAAEHASCSDIMRRELEVITGELLPLTIAILKPAAESYALQTVDPETGQQSWSYTLCDLRCRDGKLEAGEETPAEIQIKVEELNDLLREAEEEIRLMVEDEAESGRSAFQINSRRIIRLLQEVVVEYSNEIEAKQQELAVAGALQYSAPPPAFAIEDGRLAFRPKEAARESGDRTPGPQSRKTESTVQRKQARAITDALLKVALYQREIQEDSVGLLLIRDKLFPLTAKILSSIASSHDASSNAGAEYRECGRLQLVNGDLWADEDLPPALSVKVEEANFLKNKLLQQAFPADPRQSAGMQALQQQIVIPTALNLSPGDLAVSKAKREDVEPSTIPPEQGTRHNVINESAVTDKEQYTEKPDTSLEVSEASNRRAKRSRSRGAKAQIDPIAAERRRAVEAYLYEVFAKTGKRMTKDAFSKSAGYKDRGEFQRWQRNDRKATIVGSERFTRLLQEKPHLK